MLFYYSKVPIYNGCNIDFNPNTDFHRLASLPLWKDGQEDAPRQSLGVVGYTVHTYNKKNGVPSVSFNVQWLIVLGICQDFSGR
jgi:hypothetical protein